MAHGISMRQQYIDIIMERTGNNVRNLSFLNTLSIDELSNLANDSFEDEVEFAGEIFDIEDIDFN